MSFEECYSDATFSRFNWFCPLKNLPKRKRVSSISKAYLIFLNQWNLLKIWLTFVLKTSLIKSPWSVKKLTMIKVLKILRSHFSPLFPPLFYLVEKGRLWMFLKKKNYDVNWNLCLGEDCDIEKALAASSTFFPSFAPFFY